METLIGDKSFHFSDLQTISDEWQTSVNQDINISIKKEWDLTNHIEIDHFSYGCSGGSNGRLIAQHERLFQEKIGNVVKLYDHKLNLVRECRIDEKCKEIFTYITNDDELRVVTSSGRLILFQGEVVIANFPVFSPELEPTNDETNENNVPKRDREIVNVKFWETGFIYIDKDGYIVEYTIDASNLALLTQRSNKNSSANENAESNKNVESSENMHTKVISTKFKNCGNPLCFDVIPSSYSSDNLSYVFLTYEKELYVVTEKSSNKLTLKDQVIGITFSATYKFLAILTKAVSLFIIDLSSNILIWSKPIYDGNVFVNLYFIGDDNIIISFEDVHLLLVYDSDPIKILTKKNSENGSVQKNPAYIFPNRDSALILTDEAVFRTSIISDRVTRCLIGETNNPNMPARRLVKAFCSYSYEQVNALKKEKVLEMAIKDCIKAAQQFECECSTTNTNQADMQNMLMTAACFGRSYLMRNDIDDSNNNNNNIAINNPEYDFDIRDEFMLATMWIRLANMFKKQLNICISPYCLRESITAECAVKKLCGREFFSPAFEVCDEFHLNKSLVVTLWSIKIIDKIPKTDDELCFKILNNMKQRFIKEKKKSQQKYPILKQFDDAKLKIFSVKHKGSSEAESVTTTPFFDTASIALSCMLRGRNELASKLVDYDNSSATIIPFFACQGNWKESISNAAKTWNINIFTEVLLKAINSTTDLKQISDGLQSELFGYLTALNFNYYSSAFSIQMLTQVPKGNEMMQSRRQNRSRAVNQSDFLICNNINSINYFSKTLGDILNGVKDKSNVLDIITRNEFRLLLVKLKLDPSKNTIQTAFKSINNLTNKYDAWKKVENDLIDEFYELIRNLRENNLNEQADVISNLKYDGLSVNSLIRACVDLNCFDNLLSVLNRFDKKRAVSIAAHFLASKERVDDFGNLFSKNEEPYISMLDVLTKIAFYHFGPDKAIEFIELAPDKKKGELRSLIDSECPLIPSRFLS